MPATSRSLTLLISGALSAAMGLFHFFLPWVFSWEAGLGTASPEMRWALFAMNCFLSLLLLCAGVGAIASWWRPALGLSSSLTLAVFWCVNVAYQLLVPPPWPRAVALALLAFAVLAAILSLCAVTGALKRPRRLADASDAPPSTMLTKAGTSKQ